MLVNLRRAVALSVVLIVLCVLYTLVETGVGQAFFSHSANGSVVKIGNTLVGSENIGQLWTGPKWFQGRLDGYDAAASGATNYGPRSQQLYDQVRAAISNLEKEGITPTNDLVTGSGSGIDPDITPADAYAQVNAVAKANHLSVSVVDGLVAHYSAGRYLGFFGSPYVNVLSLNMGLAKVMSATHT